MSKFRISAIYLNFTHLIKAYRSKHLNFLIINLFKQIAFAQKDLPFTSYCLYNFPQSCVLLQSLTSQRHYIDNSVHNMKTNASDFFSLFFFCLFFFVVFFSFSFYFLFWWKEPLTQAIKIHIHLVSKKYMILTCLSHSFSLCYTRGILSSNSCFY